MNDKKNIKCEIDELLKGGHQEALEHLVNEVVYRFTRERAKRDVAATMITASVALIASRVATRIVYKKFPINVEYDDLDL